MQTINPSENVLVDAEALLKRLFEPNSRPSVRWLRCQQKRRVIPFYRIGRLTRFNVDEVRAALRNNCRIEVRGESAGKAA